MEKREKREKKKYKVGRPPLYNSADELQCAIEDYFENGVTKRMVLVGRKPNHEMVEMPIPTITGLCLHLGFESRNAFYSLEKRPEFGYTVKKARQLIEKEYEEQLTCGNTVGAIFALKNFGWRDTFEHRVETIENDIHALGNEELNELRDMLRERIASFRAGRERIPKESGAK